MKYFTKPNIPNKCSDRVIMDFRTDNETINELQKLGISVLKTCSIKSLYDAVCGHGDMQIHHLGGNRFVTAPEAYDYYKNNLNSVDIIKGSECLSGKYPYDIRYNAAAVGKFLFCNAACTAIEISSEYLSKDRNILNVKQGYAKCSICVINENAIITSDTGIQNTAKENGIDVLLIRPGFIELKNMSYGFIGGATGLIAPDILAVNGDISTHPDYKNIISFAKNHNVEVLSLKRGVITDIGSIIPVF